MSPEGRKEGEKFRVESFSTRNTPKGTLQDQKIQHIYKI